MTAVMDERAVVERAQAGDQDAFAALYAAQRDYVYQFILKRVRRDRDLADDLTQDTFTRALRSIGKFSWQGRPFRAWLTTIARNLVVDHFKSSRGRVEVANHDWAHETANAAIDDAADPGVRVPAQMAAAEAAATIRALLPTLTEEQRAVLNLRFYQWLSTPETADVLGKEIPAVKALQYRAVAQLRRAYTAGGVPCQR